MSDEAKWPNGLDKALEILKPIMSESYTLTGEARRRLWAARDEVERLRRLLTEAEVVLIAAERDYDDHGKHMYLVWEELKAEILKIPVRDAESDTTAP